MYEWSLVHTVSGCQGFLGVLEISIKSVRYRHADISPRERCLPTTDHLCVDDDKGMIKAVSSSLTGIFHASVHSSQVYGM